MKFFVTLCLIFILVSSGTFCQQSNFELRRINGQGNGGINLELKNGMHDSILDSPNFFYEYPVYKQNRGPVDVIVQNAQLCPPGIFTITFTGISDTSRWILYSHAMDTTIIANSTLYEESLQEIPEWGLQIKTKPVLNPGEITNSLTNGFIYSKMFYADSSKQWLNFVTDFDSNSPLNWIRSGHIYETPEPEYCDWFMPAQAFDYYEVYEGVIDRAWCPYLLAASQSQDLGGPAYSINSKIINDFEKLASIDLVITSDVSKWSRCCVIEMCHDSMLSQGSALPFLYRNYPSVNINGDTGVINNNDQLNSSFIGDTGMGWFPGYAINVETGERQNILFGENSYLAGDNGRDMLWNPTDKVLDFPSQYPIFGGFHNLYIMGSVEIDTFNFPAYDHGQYIHSLLSSAQSKIYKDYIFGSTYWVSIPLENPQSEWLDNEVTIKIRVSKKYDFFRSEELPVYTFYNGANTVPSLEENKFFVYPNPSNGKIDILVDENLVNDHATISILNMHGIHIYSAENQLLKLKNRLDLSWLTEGVYLIIIETKNKRYFQNLVLNE